MTKDEKYKAKKLRDKLRMREWRKANPEENKRRAKALRDSETPEQRAKRLKRLKDWKEKNKEHVKKYQKEWRDKNKESVAAYQKEYSEIYRKKESSQISSWRRGLKKNHKITPSDWNDIWQIQEGKCAICGIHMKPRGRAKESAAVDHNHRTKEIRGLTCRQCNRAIGSFRDDPDILISAAEYLIERGFYGSSEEDE